MATRWKRLLLASALSLGVASACNRGDDESPEGSGTSGGESSADGDASSRSETTTARRDAGPATTGSSSGAGDDGWDDDPPAATDAGVPQATSGEGTAATSGSAADAGPAASPWGATRAEQCAMPARPNMTPGARAALQEGLAAAQRGDNTTAIGRFQRALQDDSRAYRAAYNLGVIYDRSGQETQALEAYRQSLRIVPDYELAVLGIVTIQLRRGQRQDALNLVAPLAQQHRSNKLLQTVHARVLTELSRFDEAWAAARRALECDERYVPALVALVRSSLGQGRRDLAQSILDQALQVDANDAEAQYLRGSMLEAEAGRHREALDAFRRAVELRPDYVEARLALGVALLSAGNYDEALQHLEVAARLAPTLAAVHLNLGDALRAARQWERARQELEAALRIDSNLAQAHFNLALLYQAGAGQIPNVDELAALQKAVQEFQTYRTMMGPRLPPNDPSEGYLQSLDRQIRRIITRRQREARAAEEAAGRGERTE